MYLLQTGLENKEDIANFGMLHLFLPLFCREREAGLFFSFGGDSRVLSVAVASLAEIASYFLSQVSALPNISLSCLNCVCLLLSLGAVRKGNI